MSKRAEPSSAYSDKAADRSTPAPRLLRLLLHTNDGCVPYLTPALLERHFPPCAYDDLWLGLAVRDLCVTPTFEQTPKENEKKNGETPRDLKPRGYTFAPTLPDPWLLPYTRVTVPSFDLLKDNEAANRNKSKQQAADVSSTNKEVFVWTPHGRQALTPVLYANASLGLESHHTLSLYDMSRQVGNKKRQAKAFLRNQQWLQDLKTRRNTQGGGGTSRTTNIWAPVLISPDEEESSSSTTTTASSVQQQHVLEEIAKSPGEQIISGIALIGTWRQGVVQELLQGVLLNNSNVPYIAMLSTQSLLEVLEIACGKTINVIGTDLPARWTFAKRALGVDFELCKTEDNSNNNKRLKTDPSSEDGKSVAVLASLLDSDGCMDLNDKSYARDARPLVVGCSCLACKNDQFTRSYIHHLVRAKEMAADMLLFGHNLHRLLELCRSFSKTDNPEKLKDYIQAQLQVLSTKD
jgi:hypothetical protein